jgi:hypothetical protein
MRVPDAFASRLAHEREAPSCRATAATVMPGEQEPRSVVGIDRQFDRRLVRGRDGVSAGRVASPASHTCGMATTRQRGVLKGSALNYPQHRTVLHARGQRSCRMRT